MAPRPDLTLRVICIADAVVHLESTSQLRARCDQAARRCEWDSLAWLSRAALDLSVLHPWSMHVCARASRANRSAWHGAGAPCQQDMIIGDFCECELGLEEVAAVHREEPHDGLRPRSPTYEHTTFHLSRLEAWPLSRQQN